MPLFTELSRQLLKDGSAVRFQAAGGSMRPFIMGGDMVTVEPEDIGSVKIGDVVFSLGKEGPQVHRVIRKIQEGGSSALVVKGDALPGGTIVFKEELLGRVVLVEHKGRARGRGYGTNAAGLLYSYFVSCAYPALVFLRRTGRRGIGSIVENLQKSAWVRSSIRKRVNRDVSVARVKEDDLYALACFYEYDRYPNFLEMTAGLKKDIVDLDDNPSFIVAKKRGRIVGSVWAGNSAEDSADPRVWWVTGLQVGWLYRGCGIAKMLMRRVCDEAARSGAKAVRLYAFADRPHHIALYRSLGFERIGAQTPEARPRVPFEKIL